MKSLADIILLGWMRYFWYWFIDNPKFTKYSIYGIQAVYAWRNSGILVAHIGEIDSHWVIRGRLFLPCHFVLTWLTILDVSHILILSGSAYPDSLVGLTVTGLSIRSTKSLTFAAAHKSWSGFFYVVCNICLSAWYKNLLIFYAKLTNLFFVNILCT